MKQLKKAFALFLSYHAVVTCPVAETALQIADTKTRQTSEQQIKNLNDEVDRAFDFLVVKPSQSLQILSENIHHIDQASINIKIKAYITGMWAGHYVYSKDISQMYNDKLIAISNSVEFTKNAYQVLMANTTLLWRVGDYKSAKLFALCSIDFADTTPQLLSTIMALGAIARLSGQPEFSQHLYDLGLHLSRKHRQKRFEAGILNNSSVLALTNNKFEKAVSGFKDALDIRHETSHIPGQIISGTNLMLSYLYLEEWNKFERLSSRIGRLLPLNESKSHKAYYSWLMLAYNLRGKKEISPEDTIFLQDHFNQVGIASIQTFLLQLANKLQINVAGLNIQEADYKSVLEIQPSFSMCDWTELQNSTDDFVIQKLGNVKIKQ